MASLAGLMGEIGRKAAGWHALLIMLSQLPVGERRTGLSTQVVEAVESRVTAQHGTLILPTRDVLVLVRVPDEAELAEIMAVAENALKAGGQDPAHMIRQFHLERDLSQFIALLSGVDPAATKPTAAIGTAKAAAKASTAMPAGLPWDLREHAIRPKDIAKIEKMFFKANVVNFIRNQTAYRLATANGLDENHDEIFISIDYLVKFLSHQTIAGNKWLFQHFTRTLDARLLMVLGAGNEGERKETAYSLNLNVATLFAEDFLVYDRAIPARVRRGQMVEIQAFDLIENAHELPFILSFLHGRGYRLCADGVDIHLLTMLDWANVGVDAVKLQWTPELAAISDPAFLRKVSDLAAHGSIQLMLCRCDDAAALDWGAKLGISLYQGWYLDSLNKPHASDQPKPRYRIRPRDMVY